MKADLLRFLIPHLRERMGQEAHEVRSYQRILADRFVRQVPCQSMKIDRESGGFERMLRMLRDQARYHSRQNVSRTSGCHARIPGGIHPNGAIGRCYQSAMSFEHDNQLMLAS